ncbi:hypothetical protein H5087_09025 [Pseudoalteromonas sp. SR43-7]|uniref:hypothetical protein n=1 Tax=Pseudoalteromonas sp. SR43-7 TaxID=2760939 RepID=UPI0015FB673C|nr:hypothetical protein [Pseudoalteromonas sp. SR43-7]MBB1329488.1 hypothetical protein [Pseudoalteromonas sp. SR43-7]
MAKVKVKYLVEVEQDIDWPDDEMDDFTYDNLLWNCDTDDAHTKKVTEIVTLNVNGKPHTFQ